ncbi:MAG: 2-isopropylmalate synthase [Bacteroidales bacterium]|nr:2-isopropylmalate synthase [Bacteroidales bacterium]
MIEILDTTLRDGEQTAGVSFNPSEKLAIVQLLLEELKVDRVEVASARVSGGESESLSKVCDWARSKGLLNRVEVLGFIDGGKSVDWIASCGGKVVNLLAKGSLKHLETQLRKSPAQHAADIRAQVEYALSKGLEVNLYLEDWSRGITDAPEYVFGLLDALCDLPIRRYMLPDTLGVLNPWSCAKYCTQMRERFPALHFDFHAHNDYGLAVANTLAAVQAGVQGVHATVNGLGERSGNASVAAVAAALKDMAGAELALDESALTHVSRYVESISGIRIPDNEPVVGENVFTQTSGVHADGDRKGGLYENRLMPSRFGRERQYALGKMSGKANVIENLDKLGISLTPEQVKLVTERVVELGDKKEMLTAEDLPFIVADVLKSGQGSDNIHIVNYSLQITKDMKPAAMLKVSIDGQEYETSSNGDGQYHAFMRALWKIYDRLGKKHPVLADYQVSIPPGGKTDALVATTIVWDMDGHSFKTRGIDSDQAAAAIKATVKMLNIIENLDISTLK